ncbi:MAG TPA: NUDIX hydrolase [Candidatus Saccharimonadales bacterium]|nr:NUDIX hydrolase [Candidatus Saccharimonadales bacterium]
MHYIQAKILQRLLYVAETNYADLRPEGIESNLFAYHLEQLLKDKMIAKVGKAYRLSPRGLAYIDRLSHTKMADRLQPHIVTAIDVVAASGETLLFKRNFQPYLYLLGFPLGKLHYEEPVIVAARRELEEKTGLLNLPLVHRGMVYIQASQEGTTIGRVLYHVFHADIPVPLPVVAPAARGECVWADYRQLDPACLMPGFLQVKALLETNSNLFFDEITTEL